MKVLLGSWQTSTTLSLASYGGNTVDAAAIDPEGGYAYYAVSDASAARVLKIDLDTFTVADSLTLSSSGQARGVVVDHAGDYAYFGFTAISPAKIFRVSLSTFSVIDSLTLSSSEMGINTAVIDVSGGHAYFAAGTGVVRVRLSDFTRDGFAAWSGTSLAYNVYSGTVDATGGYAYFSVCGASGDSHIAKVRLSDGALVSSLDVDGNVFPLYFSAIDNTTRLAYFSTGHACDLFALDLSTFTSVGDYTIPGGGQLIYGGVVDQATECAYIGQHAGSDGLVKLLLTGPPPAPTGFGVAAVTTGTMVWSWTDPSGGHNATRLWADAGTPAPVTCRLDVAAGTTSCTLGGLTPNLEVSAQIAALNAGVASTRTAVVTAWTLAARPETPLIGLRTKHTVQVSIAPADGNPAGTLYAILVTPSTDPALWLQADGTLAGTAVWRTAAQWADCTVTTLRQDVEYDFAALARNGAGVQSDLSLAVRTSLVPVRAVRIDLY